MNAFTEGDKVQVDGATHEGHFFTFFEEVHGREAPFRPGSFSRVTFDLSTGKWG